MLLPAALIKDLYILLYSYLLFYLTVTLSIHGNSNMEVLTPNERMSAITIFSLYFDVDQNVSVKKVWHTEKTLKFLSILYFPSQPF